MPLNRATRRSPISIAQPLGEASGKGERGQVLAFGAAVRTESVYAELGIICQQSRMVERAWRLDGVCM